MGLFRIELKCPYTGELFYRQPGKPLPRQTHYFIRADDGNRTRRILLGKQVLHLGESSAFSFHFEPSSGSAPEPQVYETRILLTEL